VTMSTQRNASGGVSFLGLLALLFIGLKLGNVIDWSWWLVLSPLWGPPALLLGLFLVLMLIAGICQLLERVTQGR
jgi:hypothetical protein